MGEVPLYQVDVLLNTAYKNAPADKATLKADLSTSKELVKGIINKCLSETQKLHVGSSVSGFFFFFITLQHIVE